MIPNGNQKVFEMNTSIRNSARKIYVSVSRNRVVSSTGFYECSLLKPQSIEENTCQSLIYFPEDKKG